MWDLEALIIDRATAPFSLSRQKGYVMVDG